MKHWQEQEAQIARQLHQTDRIGIVTDFDGTISPIVNQPDAAQITPKNRDLLEQLANIADMVAVVSGRTLSDLQSRLSLPNLIYIGSHGMEKFMDGNIMVAPETTQYGPVYETILKQLQDLPERFPGVSLENKVITLAVHYREAVDPETAGAYLQHHLPLLASQHNLKLYEGRKVFEFRPPINLDKGTILRQLVEDNDLALVFYLGDDVTDADAMLMAHRLRDEKVCDAWALAVKSAEMPNKVKEAADLFLNDIADVETFLGWLLAQLQLLRE